MIQLPDLALPAAVQQQLTAWQQEINALPTYPERVQQSKSSFENRNTPKNPTFRQIRKVLTTMCSGACRCAYCEDSAADEVEHIKPKDLYPEAVFVWSNYVYACGPCNGPKNNQFAVFSQTTGQFVDVTRKRGSPIVPPEAGDPILINPRWENPLDFMQLDLQDTFFFLPLFDLADHDRQRAEYTIDVLRLNQRDLLPEARREAFGSYKARLGDYIRRRDNGETSAQLQPAVTALQRMQHPTVWREMQRQHPYVPELKLMFDAAPEALNW